MTIASYVKKKLKGNTGDRGLKPPSFSVDRLNPHNDHGHMGR